MAHFRGGFSNAGRLGHCPSAYTLNSSVGILTPKSFLFLPPPSQPPVSTVFLMAPNSHKLSLQRHPVEPPRGSSRGQVALWWRYLHHRTNTRHMFPTR